MEYLITVANGDWMVEKRIVEVKVVKVEQGVYVFYDERGVLLFSARIDSTVSVELA